MYDYNNFTVLIEVKNILWIDEFAIFVVQQD